MVSHSIAQDYIQYYLRKNNFTWGPDRRATVIELAMRCIGDEFEEHQGPRADYLMLEMDDQIIRAFYHVTSELFNDGHVNWGRIVTIFVFAARLSLYCFQNNMPHAVDNIVDCLTDCMDNTLGDWMTDNHGWNGFLEFANLDVKSLNMKARRSVLKTLSYYAGVGVLTVASMFAYVEVLSLLNMT